MCGSADLNGRRRLHNGACSELGFPKGAVSMSFWWGKGREHGCARLVQEVSCLWEVREEQNTEGVRSYVKPSAMVVIKTTQAHIDRV